MNRSLLRTLQSGFTLVELMIVLAISAVAYRAYLEVVDFSDKRARGEVIASAYEPYVEALSNYTLRFRTELQNASTITGVVSPLAPTAAELRTLQLLGAAYPDSLPMLAGATATFRVERVPLGCTGQACDLAMTFWAPRPILNTRGFTSSALGYAARKIGADAGTSDYDTPGVIQGIGGWTIPNPAGNVASILAVYKLYSASSVARFLQQGDTRDPRFAGGATITGGTTSVSSLAVTGTVAINGTLTLGCVTIDPATGRSGFGCLDRSSLPAGYTGGVVSPDVVASRNLLVSDNRAAFTGNNTNYALATSNDGSGAAALATSGRVSGDRLVPRGSYNPNDACSDEAAIARNGAGQGTVVCIGGRWRVQSTIATASGACTTNGATAQGTNGETLLCVSGSWESFANLVRSGTPGGNCTTLNTVAVDSANGYGSLVCRRNLASSGTQLSWYRLADITSQLQFVTSVEVTHGATLTAPTCPVATGQSVLPIAQFRVRSETSSDGGFNRLAIPISSTQWQINLTNGAGQPLTSTTGSAIGLVDLYCYYA
jgi:prepilin-type N-terminal cleavage/methylation domain-containing protein